MIGWMEEILESVQAEEVGVEVGVCRMGVEGVAESVGRAGEGVA